MNAVAHELQILQAEIATCRICHDLTPELGKSEGMERGDPDAPVMVIGEAPGETELLRARAFSGQSGKRLDEWLVGCGADDSQPRRRVYVTSVLKCSAPTGTPFSPMAKNCFRFLSRQLEIVKPRLMITLGANAYEFFRFAEIPYDSALCQVFHSTSYFLFPRYWDSDFQLLVWPHPSGRNRWLNQKRNLDRLSDSFKYVRPFLQS